MTCLRCNHDIKFIPSGKDGKNVTFYVTDYATKSNLSTHQMLPLIAASMKKVNLSNVSNDAIARSKSLITKCLNRITTETEISASHVSHFLLGHLDKITSHYFTRLNLHCALAWLASHQRKYNETVTSTSDTDNDSDLDTNDNNDEDDDNDHGKNDDENETGRDTVYNVTHGNEGLVLVNLMTDYIYRGNELSHMCLYDYSSKVYKTIISSEKEDDKNTEKKANTRRQPRYFFSEGHPQSQTHKQAVRGVGLVPSLSKLPPSSANNEEKYQKCILLLFKPFHVFTDLFNGTSWNESYETADFTGYTHFIDNIQEMHIGIEDRKKIVTT